jgi:hypothetical protein
MSYDLDAALERVEARFERTGIFDGEDVPAVELEHDDPRVLLTYAGMDVDARKVEHTISQLVAAHLAGLVRDGVIEHAEDIDDRLLAAMKGLAAHTLMLGWELAQP